MEHIAITYPDQATNRLAVFPAVQEASKVFIIFPALGVRASFYKQMAEKIAASGSHAVSVDWRGLGHSSVRPGRGINYFYCHLIDDMKLAVEAILQHFPQAEPILIGHSLGGQLGSLLISRYPELVNKMSIVAACSVYYKGWEGSRKRLTWVVGHLFHRLANLLGHFPGDKIGFGGREFPGVMKDWGHNAVSGKYTLTGDNFDYEAALQSVSAHIKSFSIDKDIMAPPAAMKNLTDKFGPNVSMEYMHLTADVTGAELNHFSWAKKSDAVVRVITDW